MQLKQVSRDALLKPLQAVSGIVERRQTLPILANVLLEQKDGRLFVTATDLEMQITANSELASKQDQAVTVGARKLQDLLRALPEDSSLTVDTAAGKMTVRAGRSRFNLQTLPAADYPRIGLSQEQQQTIALPQRDFRGLLSKVVDGKFPDYNRVIPSGHSKQIDLSRAELLQALQRAAILSNEKFRGVRLVLATDQLKIICTNSEQEEAEEELEIAYKGEPLDIGFNITYLLDVLHNLAADRVVLALGDANSSALITMPERGDYKYVVMPMRI